MQNDLFQIHPILRTYFKSPHKEKVNKIENKMKVRKRQMKRQSSLISALYAHTEHIEICQLIARKMAKNDLCAEWLISPKDH